MDFDMVTDGGMAQPDGADDEHAIDMEAGRPMGESGCPVCTEPAEWVAVGPCGHGEVCANCAVRMRFFDRNWRCCICRAFCPTVVITNTKAGSGSTGPGQQPQGSGEGAAFSAPPLAAGGAGQVGMYLSYHSGVAAYFDNPEQYEKARQMCLRSSSSSLSLHHHPAPRDEEDALPDDAWMFVLIVVVGSAIVGGLLTGLPVAVHLQLQHWHHRILVVLAFGSLYGALTYLGFFWMFYMNEGSPHA